MNTKVKKELLPTLVVKHVMQHLLHEKILNNIALNSMRDDNNN